MSSDAGETSTEPSRSRSSAARLRGVFALGRHRIGERFGARVGALAALGIAVVFGLAASSSSSTTADAIGGDVATTLRWASWLAAGPYALALAGPLVGRDRDEGLVDLASLSGVTERRLEIGRGLAAVVGAAWRILLPVVVVVVVGTVRAPSLLWAAVTLGALLASVVVGSSLAGLALTCGRLAEQRGRTLFLAVVLLPWLAAGSASLSGWSVVGILDGLIELSTRGVG